MIEARDQASLDFAARAKAAKTYQELLQVTEAANASGRVLYLDPEKVWHCYALGDTTCAGR